MTTPADIHLLVVDDDDDDLAAVCMKLEHDSWDTNIRVRTAQSLREAIDKIDTDQPDCVLLDLQLSDAHDLGAVQRLLMEWPALPIVVISAAQDSETATRALRAGAQDYLVKGPDLTSEAIVRAVSFATYRVAARHALVASNEQLTAFSARVAHDLRSPLAIAMGMLQLLERKAGDTLPDDLTQLLTRAIGGTRRAIDLVSALLAYAQASHPDEGVDIIDLGPVLDWVQTTIEFPRDARLDVASPMESLMVNEAAIQQVMQNVISNAIKYREPTVPLIIEVSTASAARGLVEVTVADNGMGIPVELRDRALSAGERLGREGDGFGYGLAAVAATVQRYGGDVHISDGLPRPDGVGTRIHMTLPVGA